MAVKIGKLVAMAMALGGLTIGCGDDDAPPSGGSETGSTDTGSTGPVDPSTTTMQADSSGTTAGSGSGSAEGGESSSSSGEPPPIEVTVEGEVVDFTAMGTPIVGAEISLFDDPGGPLATSDDSGLFSLGPLMPDTTPLLVVAPSDDYWGAIIPVEVGADPLQEGVQLSQIPSAFVDLQIMLLEPQMPAMADFEQAIMIVRLIDNTAVSEGPTTIEMSPAPDPGTFYAPNDMGAPVLDQDTIEFAALPVVVFFNVADAAPGDITFTPTHPTRECEVLYPGLPALGQHITLVDIQCLPPA